MKIAQFHIFQRNNTFMVHSSNIGSYFLYFTNSHNKINSKHLIYFDKTQTTTQSKLNSHTSKIPNKAIHHTATTNAKTPSASIAHSTTKPHTLRSSQRTRRQSVRPRCMLVLHRQVVGWVGVSAPLLCGPPISAVRRRRRRPKASFDPVPTLIYMRIAFHGHLSNTAGANPEF